MVSAIGTSARAGMPRKTCMSNRPKARILAAFSCSLRSFADCHEYRVLVYWRGVLSKRPIGYGAGQLFRVANRLADMNAQRRMPLPDVLHHFWQIFLEMSAPGQKNR